MRSLICVCLILGAGVSPAIADESPAPEGAAAPAAAPPPDKEQQSYAIGVDIIRRFEKLEAEVDVAALTRGIADAAAHRPLALSDDDLKKAGTTFQSNVAAKQAAAQQRVRDANGKQGDDYRAQYARLPGVVQAPSGLMYRVLESGGGHKPKDEDTIEVRYIGRLTDGRVFDQSKDDGPVPVHLRTLIRGWREALPLMTVGTKFELVIPPQLAYGDRGNGREIGPNMTLFYQVELTGIKAPDQP